MLSLLILFSFFVQASTPGFDLLTGVYEIHESSCQPLRYTHVNISVDFKKSDVLLVTLIHEQSRTGKISVGEFDDEALQSGRSEIRDGEFRWHIDSSYGESLRRQGDILLYATLECRYSLQELP